MDWEYTFDSAPAVQFIIEKWWLSIAASIVYVIVVFGGRRIMANKKPFQLDGLLSIWNLALSTFSVCGMLRLVPHVAHLWSTKGFDWIITSKPELVYSTGVSSFWMIIFTFSKFPELIDTVFIVLRKKPLLFLHWYHHITVLMICWDSFAAGTSAGLLFAAMNYTVHAIMYAYYSGYLPFRALWAPVITTLQILQMVLGVAITLRCGYFKFYTDRPVAMSDISWLSFFVLYGSYLYLFVDFAVRRYCLPRPTKKTKTA